MSNCGKDFDRELIRDEILKMIQEGILQPAVHDCNGNRIGQWAEVLVCGATGPAPTPGVDKDTKNRDMTWDLQTQDVSVVDTANNTVSTKILFNTVDAPPVNASPQFTEYFGEGAENVLSKPAEWISVKAADGVAYKIPVYFDDVVTTEKCPQVTIDPREFHIRTKYLFTPENGRIRPAEVAPLSLDDRFTAYDIFTLVNQQLFDQGFVLYSNDYIYTTFGWIKYSDVHDRDSGEVTTYSIIWERSASGSYTKSFEFPRYRLNLNRATGKVELYKIGGVAPPCGEAYPEFKVTLYGWYAAGNACMMFTRYTKHEFVIPVEELLHTPGPDEYAGVFSRFMQKLAPEQASFGNRLENLMEEFSRELSTDTLVTDSFYGIDLIESPFGIMEKDPSGVYFYNVYHTTETSIMEGDYLLGDPLETYYKLEPAVDNGHRVNLDSSWKWSKDHPGLDPM